ncbi:profilin, required for normal timing of actin polymerization in response to thermal stress [Mortierella sp. AM989]|nr:profilin, required for normal timing of actin polymerization in response to thermal stress [Mortierella sp. AM989]
MSWQAYVDTNLVGTGKVAKGALLGHDGSLWATSPDFKVGADEAKNLIAAFDDINEISKNGLKLEGNKYVFLRNIGNSIYARNGSAGVCCTKTGQAVIVGYYDATMQAGGCNTVVEGLGTYLIGQGY